MSRLKPQLTFANVISVIALFLALGGSAYAVKFKLKANQVTSRNIAPDAVTGEDAAESTFGKVPSAANADSASTAGNASTAGTANTAGTAQSLGGNSPNDYVFSGSSDGVQLAQGRIPNDGATSTVTLVGGALRVACDATPELLWVNDTPGDGFDTDIWFGSGSLTHTTVADGAASTSLDPDMNNQSNEVMIWTGSDLVWRVSVGVFWDAANTECLVSYFVHGETNT